ncbi:MAG: M42 family metallopeptidase [Aristaeellaceae bacterium]
MDIQKVLSEAAAICGPSGQEKRIAEHYAALFRPLVDEVRVDKLYNVIAHRKGSGPRVMLCAHMDEISLMVTKIEDDGSLRMGMVGGVDPRILPASRVWVHGREKLFGTIGALPPHLMSQEDRERNYAMKELHVDVGLPADKVRELVQVGDLVTLDATAKSLLNGQMSSKTMDDRACVALMLLTAEKLQRMRCDADVYFVATTQEEVGSQGAMTAAFGIEPDLGIMLDVQFAHQLGVSKDKTVPLDTLTVCVGPYLQPRLNRRLTDCAKANNIALTTVIANRATWTDADEVGIARAGVPCVLISPPVKYMHTSVETIDTHTLEEGSRLLTSFLSELEPGWEVDLWI